MFALAANWRFVAAVASGIRVLALALANRGTLKTLDTISIVRISITIFKEISIIILVTIIMK